MKLNKLKPTQLSRVCKVLDDCKVQYVRASVEAVDKENGKQLGTEVVMLAGVFHRSTGKYLFSGPVVNPMMPGVNHKPS